jgi:hypothetical protein
MLVVMDLPSVVRTISARLDAELQGTSDIKHRASKGRVREALLMGQVLQRILPETVGVAHGAEIACSDGSTSGECDLVVYDRDLPPLYRAEGFTVLPIEAVLGIIEVKSFLDRRALIDAVDKAHRIKLMERTALRRDETDFRRVSRHGRVWETPPVSAHVVGFNSLDLRTLAEHLRKAEDGRPRWECLESVYVLGKGCLSDAMGAPQRLIFDSASRDSMVLAMVIEFINLFQRGWQPRFNPGPYLGEIPIGRVLGTFGGWNEDGSPSEPKAHEASDDTA